MDPSQALLRAATCPLYRILGAVRWRRGGDAIRAAWRWRFAPSQARALRRDAMALTATPRPTSLRGFVRRHDGASRRPCVRAARHDGASRRRQAAIRATTRRRFAPPICPRGVAMALRPTSSRGFDRRHDGAPRRPCVRAVRRRRFAPPTRRVPGHDATALRASPRLCFSWSQDGASRRTASMLRTATRPCAACSASRRRHDGASRRLGVRASRRRRFAPPIGRIPGHDATALRAAPRPCASRSHDGASRRIASVLGAATRRRFAPPHVLARRHRDAASRRPSVRVASRFAPPRVLARCSPHVRAPRLDTTALRAAPRLRTFAPPHVRAPRIDTTALRAAPWLRAATRRRFAPAHVRASRGGAPRCVLEIGTRGPPPGGPNQ